MHQPLFYLVFIKKILFWIDFKIIESQDVILSGYNKKPYSVHYPNWWISNVFRCVHVVITQTLYGKKDLIFHYNIPETKIVVIPNWVIGKIHKKYGKKYDLIYCGRFAQEKRLDRMMRVIVKVKKIIPDIRAIFFGGGSELSSIQKSIASENLETTIFIRSSQDFVMRYMSQSKIFLLTSDLENFPMVILEAMASGAVPIVLTFPGVEEFIVYGKTGYFENTEEDLVKRIVDTLNNKKKMVTIVKNAKNQSSLFNERLIKKTLNCIGNLLAYESNTC